MVGGANKRRQQVRSRPWRLSSEEAKKQREQSREILGSGKDCKGGIDSRLLAVCMRLQLLKDHDEVGRLFDDEFQSKVIDKCRQVATNNCTEDEVASTMSEIKGVLLTLGGQALADKVFSPSTALRVKKSSTLQRIVPRIYLGSWNALNNDCSLLRERSITHVVSILSAPARKLPKFIKGRLHILMNDRESQGEDLLRRFPDICAFADKALENNRHKIYFHCGAGISRGPTSCIAFLMHFLRLPAIDALHLVRDRRHCIRPNLGFTRALKQWEAIVASKH